MHPTLSGMDVLHDYLLTNILLCFAVSVPRITLQPEGFLQGTVGQLHDMICTVTISSVVDPKGVELTWTKAGNAITTDERVYILPTNVTANLYSFTYRAIIRIAYLMEGDGGNYTCTVIADKTVETHSITLHAHNVTSKFLFHICICELNLYFTVLTPTVRIFSINTQMLYERSNLQCNVTAVRGITSRVDIIWKKGNTTVRRVEDVTANLVENTTHFVISSVNHTVTAVYSDEIVTPPLGVSDDGEVYQCEVIINTNPRINATGRIVLDFPGE